jgi:hypothetical protein
MHTTRPDQISRMYLVYIFLLIIGQGSSSRPFLPTGWKKLQILCHLFFITDQSYAAWYLLRQQ